MAIATVVAIRFYVCRNANGAVGQKCYRIIADQSISNGCFQNRMLIGGALKSIEIVFYTDAGGKANVAICCEHINDQRQKYQMVFCANLVIWCAIQFWN